MVTTRKATGSLPAPKRKNVADIDFSDEEGYSDEAPSEEENDRQPAKKRTKKTTSKGRGETSDEHASSSSREQRSSLHDDMRQMDHSGNGGDAEPQSRMNSLVTGQESKGELAKSNGTIRKPKRKPQLRKSDMGKLSRVMDLSVEVFCEIANYLTPVDLLQLSRTSRSLRKFILSKSSRVIWVACLAATGIPACPPDMSEPQYANLYFEKECHACGYPRVDRLTFHLRIRLCHGCSKLNVVQGKVLVEQHFKGNVSQMFEIYSLLPWNNLDVYDENSFRTINSRIQNRYFLKYDFLEVVKAYLQTEPNSEERKSFVKKRHEVVRNIVESVREVATWQQQRYNDRFRADHELSRKRKEQIREKLHDLGYSYEEIDSLWHMPYDLNHTRIKWTHIVHQPRELSHRIWKNIQPKLEELIRSKRQFDKLQVMEENRGKRKSELASLYQEYIFREKSEKRDIAPLSFVDLCMIPFVTGLIEEDECGIEITRERWRLIEGKLPELFDEHAKKVERDCLDILVNSASTDTVSELSDSEIGAEGGNIDPSILWRAYVFFSDWSGFREIATLVDVFSSMREHMFSEVITKRSSWNRRTLSLNTTAIRAANALLSSLALPKETRMQQMQALGQVFVCQQCDPVLRKRMTWWELVLHVYREVDDYRRVQEHRAHRIWPIMPVFFETHRVAIDEADTRLVIIDADFVEPSVESFTYINEAVDGVHEEKLCYMCSMAAISKPFLYEEQLAAHSRAYHGANAGLEG
ncbi:hypothetical protein ACEPAH_8571 [Sanghuangporus vaninii]